MRKNYSKCSHIESYTHIKFLQCQQTYRLYVELKAALQAVNCCTQPVVVANSNESSRLRSQGFWRGCWCGLTGRVRVTSVRKDSSFLPVWPTEVTFSDCQVKIVGEEQAQQVFPYRILYTHYTLDSSSVNKPIDSMWNWKPRCKQWMLHITCCGSHKQLKLAIEIPRLFQKVA